MFKVGDRVRCVKASPYGGYDSDVGKDYIVISVTPNTGFIKLRDDGEYNNPERFELVGVTATTDWDKQLDAAFEKQRAIGGEVKGYKPDAIDWDKHKQYMKGL